MRKQNSPWLTPFIGIALAQRDDDGLFHQQLGFVCRTWNRSLFVQELGKDWFRRLTNDVSTPLRAARIPGSGLEAATTPQHLTCRLTLNLTCSRVGFLPCLKAGDNARLASETQRSCNLSDSSECPTTKGETVAWGGFTNHWQGQR